MWRLLLSVHSGCLQEYSGSRVEHRSHFPSERCQVPRQVSEVSDVLRPRPFPKVLTAQSAGDRINLVMLLKSSASSGGNSRGAARGAKPPFLCAKRPRPRPAAVAGAADPRPSPVRPCRRPSAQLDRVVQFPPAPSSRTRKSASDRRRARARPCPRRASDPPRL